MTSYAWLNVDTWLEATLRAKVFGDVVVGAFSLT
jgi:hypothetical protein